MKNKFILSIGALALLSSNLLALYGPHKGLAASSAATDNDEVCVYCHTPHAANNAFDGPVPLWNKPTTQVTFYMYGASDPGVAGRTIAGTMTDAQPTDQSLACLSCHDGVSAMDSVINAPGSGRYNPAGTPIGGYAPGVVANMVTAEERAVGFRSATSGSFGDMRNDHPISIQYIEGRASLKPKNTPLTNWLGASTINDVLRNGKVQCSSCHDPHDNTNQLYKRASNAGSALCLSCHNK